MKTVTIYKALGEPNKQLLIETSLEGNHPNTIYEDDARKIFRLLDALPSGTIAELAIILEKKWKIWTK